MPKSMEVVFAPDRPSGCSSACRLASVANSCSADMLIHPLELPCVSASTLCSARLIIMRDPFTLVSRTNTSILCGSIGWRARVVGYLPFPRAQRTSQVTFAGVVRLRGLTRWSSAPTRGAIVAMATTLMIVLRTLIDAAWARKLYDERLVVFEVRFDLIPRKPSRGNLIQLDRRRCRR